MEKSAFQQRPMNEDRSVFVKYHNLKLYPDGECAPQPTKKLVVVESYDEMAFPDPTEAFFARIQKHPALTLPGIPSTIKLPPTVPIEVPTHKKWGDTIEHPLSHWFHNFF